ncbi:hypothetical protein Desaci_1953 [Desulfosporosinus acidiphilus SJ4]|uniref:Uncharacterized protein n=1 Tax=Desulfosporosinus acidiphilus (strain DSM 22704 / JCM 16185 / SJ4) TaxID=646529 RepID=I4D556_DESAJ|nr:hypothetical protein [Desulfosporosinus acidiphilus]AFM40930.1 hypothetical protein Desaci_1953 [Desulfosporosinus acidiphilus SJ4]
MLKDNPNKIWVVARPYQANNPEYSQYNDVAEALSDFDDWTQDRENIAGCEVLFRGITLMESSSGKVRGALCEQYHPDCSVRNKLPNPEEIVNCEECITRLMIDHVE